MVNCDYITEKGTRCRNKRGSESEFCTFHRKKVEKLYCKYQHPGTDKRCFNSKFQNDYCSEHYQYYNQVVNDQSEQCVVRECQRPASFHSICGIHYNTLSTMPQLAALGDGLYLSMDKNRYIITGTKDGIEISFKSEFAEFDRLRQMARDYIGVVGTPAAVVQPAVVQPVAVVEANNNAIIDVDPECRVCYDEIVERDTVRCGSGHEFCKTCVEKQLTVKISEGNPSSKCWECGEELDLLIIDPTIASQLIESKQHQNVTQFAAICDDFQICPFCNIWGCIVVDDYNNPWIPCENCAKTWCKKCRGEGHRGNCNIIGEPTIEKVRQRVAMIIDEAYMRKCPYCNTPYIKDFGCNLMECEKCKGMMCFICNQKLVPKKINGVSRKYWHFKGSGCSEPGANCPLYNDITGGTEDQGNQEYIDSIVKQRCSELINANDDLTGKMIRKVLKKEYKIRL